MNNKKLIKRAIIWLPAIAIVVILMYISNIQCLIKEVIGLPCPTCGMTRAWVSVLRLDFKEAFWWHPLFPIAILILYLLIDNDNPRRWFQILLASTVVLLTVVFIVRLMHSGWDTPPLDINRDAILFKVIKYLGGN